MDPLSQALAVLTAMITPAVLISACGALILSTSTRLGRVVDRVRSLSDYFEEMAAGEAELPLAEERRAAVFDQLDKLTSRARILQRSMTVFYVALGLFVATSVSIGFVAFVGLRYSVLPVALGLVGASFLFYGSIILIVEARLSAASLRAEMDFLWRLSKHHAPEELVRQRSPHYRFNIKPRG
jgi:threonine/homoserine/homoserine lactone efflux protein